MSGFGLTVKLKCGTMREGFRNVPSRVCVRARVTEILGGSSRIDPQLMLAAGLDDRSGVFHLGHRPVQPH